jgi:hypothetical protein
LFRHYNWNVTREGSLRFAAMMALFVRLPAFGSGCGANPQLGWREFLDRSHHICFWYPSSYHLKTKVDTADVAGNTQARVKLISRTPRRADANDRENSSITVWFLTEPFQLDRMIKDAPNGLLLPPTAKRFGPNVFYFYGAGGGGVAYPDVYFFDHRGQTAKIVFDGPYGGEGKSPIGTAQAIEKTFLLSFKQKLR